MKLNPFMSWLQLLTNNKVPKLFTIATCSLQILLALNRLILINITIHIYIIHISINKYYYYLIPYSCKWRQYDFLNEMLSIKTTITNILMFSYIYIYTCISNKWTYTSEHEHYNVILIIYVQQYSCFITFVKSSKIKYP